MRVTSSAFWDDTFYLRNNHIAGPPSFTRKEFSHDGPEVTPGLTTPILLTQFKVALNYERVLIDWSTSWEPNNKYFTIERSNDGINYSFLGFIVAGTNPLEQNDYRLIDYSPKDGINYYRLMQTDRLGRIRYFGCRIVNYGNSQNFSAGITSLSNGNIKMIINSGRKDDLSLYVLDTYGKETFHESFTVATGSTTKTFFLQKGSYMAVLSNSTGEIAVNKIVIQ